MTQCVQLFNRTSQLVGCFEMPNLVEAAEVLTLGNRAFVRRSDGDYHETTYYSLLWGNRVPRPMSSDEAKTMLDAYGGPNIEVIPLPIVGG